MKNNLTNLLIILILSFNSGISFTQVLTVGPVQNIAYGFRDVYPVGENSFFVQHYDKLSGTKLILTHYSNFVEDGSTGTITSDDCGVLIVDGKLTVFQNVKKNGIVTLTAQEYGADCKTVGDAKSLMTYKIISGTLPREEVSGSVVQSENGEYFAVIFKVEHKGKVQFSFHIYDKSYKSVREGFIDSPYDNFQLSKPDKYLSNQGNLYFSCFKGVKKIWKLEDNTFNELAIKFEGFSIGSPVLYEMEDGTLKCAGVGSETGSTDLELLIGTLNFTNKSVLLENRVELTKDFIGFNDLSSGYIIPNIVFCENGNTVFVIDQYAMASKSINNGGIISYQPLVTYYDTKVLLLDKKYETLWTANLGHANQVSYFGEYQKTFHLEASKDELVFYMDLNKTRTGMEIPQTFSVSLDHQAEDDNCLGKISVDMETGEKNRKLLCDQIDCDWLSYCVSDEFSGGVLVAFHKGLIKYRFGSIK